MKLFNKHVEDRFADYLDSRMDEADGARFEEHLRGCDYCRLQYEATRQSVIALRSLPIVDVPRTFVLNEAMLAESSPRRAPRTARWQPIAAPAAGFAVLSLLLFGGDLATSGDGDDTAESPVPFEASTDNSAREDSEQAAPAESFADDSGADGGAEDGEATEALDADSEEATEEAVAEEADQQGDGPIAEEEAAGPDESSITQDPPASGGDDDDAAEPIVVDSAVDEDDEDDLRLYVRVLAAVAGMAALVLAAFSVKRWLEQRKTV